MLTNSQKYLFKELEADPADEKRIRQLHKDAVKDGRAVKDFTRWLTNKVHAKWRRENQRLKPVYVGD